MLKSSGYDRCRHPLRRRIEASLLLSAMFVGCQLLWLAVPAVALWGLASVMSDALGYLLASMVLIPTALAAFAWLLGLANRRYLSLTALAETDDEDENQPRLRGPLESILSGSVVVAMLALVVWIAAFAGHISLALE